MVPTKLIHNDSSKMDLPRNQTNYSSQVETFQAASECHVVKLLLLENEGGMQIM